MRESPSTPHVERWTIIGSRGWIAQALARALEAQGATVQRCDRGDAFPTRAGHLVWCTGVSFGAATRVRDAYRAHVIDVDRWLDAPGTDTFTYLSSTRVYDLATDTSEIAPLCVPAGDVYALTKAAGERLVLDAAPSGRVIRLSNVFGNRFDAPYFLNDVLRAAVTRGHIELSSALDSGKDYVDLAQVVGLIPQIVRAGRERIYNVAAGRNTTHAQIIAHILARDPGVRTTVAAAARRVTYPVIDTRRLRTEFGFEPTALVDRLAELLADARAHFSDLARPADSAARVHDGARASD